MRSLRGDGSDNRQRNTAPVRQAVLFGVAVLLSAAALLAVGILLFGELGETEGRILGTVAVLAGYGLLTVPAAVLRDQRRLPLLGGALAGSAVFAAGLTIGTIWLDEPGETFGKVVGTTNGWLVVLVQTSVLVLRRRERDPRSVKALFVASTGVVAGLATMLTVLIWFGIDSELYGRLLGAGVVLDVLLVALQPILARAQRPEDVHRLRVLVAPGDPVELCVEAPDLATAASRAIRLVEGGGRHVTGLELVESPTELVDFAGRAGLRGTPAIGAGSAPRSTA